MYPENAPDIPVWSSDSPITMPTAPDLRFGLMIKFLKDEALSLIYQIHVQRTALNFHCQLFV